MHALIIDDDKNSLRVLSQVLSMEGITSTTINAPTTLDRVLQDPTPINVVFLDLEMPGVDGYTVLDTLRANPRFENVPIVACTVHTSLMSDTRERGFHSFIGKPINVDRFPAQLRQILNGQSVWAK